MNEGGRPKKYETIEEVESIVNEYFENCDSNHIPYTVTGLALALDIDRRTLLRWCDESDKFCPTIRKAKLRVENYLEQQLYKNNATGVIFNLKNNFKWKDEQEVANNINVNNYSNLTEEELRKLAE